MSVLRVFYPNLSFHAEECIVEGEEAHHLLKVLRARIGEKVALLDGQGRVLEGIVSGIQAKKAYIKVLDRLEMKAEPLEIHLLQALPKGRLLEEILRQGTELGLGFLQPLYTSRTEVCWKMEREKERLSRWRLIAQEACKQSGNLFLPKIVPPVPLLDYLEGLPEKKPGELRLVASLQEGACDLMSVLLLQPSLAQIRLLVGPEGDFSPKEYAQIDRLGFQGVRLAAHVLRVETAALYALSVVRAYGQSQMSKNL